MSINVFAVGRSGSGKSTAVCYMKWLAKNRHYSTIHIRDYTILLAMSKEPEYQEKFRPNARDGFDVLNFSVLDVALERLFVKLSTLESSHKFDIIFIEFARQRYEDAFKKLGTRLQNKYNILFVEANLDTCIERIDRRTLECCGEDQHYISDEIMKNYFSVDNWPYMNNSFVEQLDLPPNHLMTICNESSIEQLEKETEYYANIIFRDVINQRKIASQARERKKLFSSHTLKELRAMIESSSHNHNVITTERELVAP